MARVINMTTNRDERIAAILTKHAQEEVTEHKHVHRPKILLEHTFTLGEENKNKLKQLAPGPFFMTAYLDYVASLNNPYNSWLDTRPNELKQQDSIRLAANTLPLWSYGLDAGGRVRLSLDISTIRVFSVLATMRGIGRQTYVSLSNIGPQRNLSYEGIRSTPLDKLIKLNDYMLATYSIRAFLCGFLTPVNNPVIDETIKQLISPHRESLKLHNRGRKIGSVNRH